MKTRFLQTRRNFIANTGVALAALASPAISFAQTKEIRLGTLTPLSGAGGSYGTLMQEAMAKVVAEINGTGGINGQQIILSSEDDQTSPEAGVRAARKLIDVDKVGAILGTWASSVTTAVAPLCWESKTALFTVSGADSITQLPHQGYIFRTQPPNTLLVEGATNFILDDGGEKLAFLGLQTPFAENSVKTMTRVAKDRGKSVESLIYEGGKTSYRSEVDQILRGQPDWILLGGYTPDNIIVLQDLYRAGYKGKIIGFAFAINSKLIESLPNEVTNGIVTFQGASAVDSVGYKKLLSLLDRTEVDPYTAQAFDHINLALLAIARAGGSSGTEIRDNVRAISQGDGQEVNLASEGIPLLAKGESVNYAGASGPCDFSEIGDITSGKLRYTRVEDGKSIFIKIA